MFNNKKVLLLFAIGISLLTGCEKRAKDEPARASLFADHPCITRPDGSLNCSDVR